MSLYKLVSDVFGVPNYIAHNVLEVYDVFSRPIRKNAEHFYGRKKNVAEKNGTKGVLAL